LGGFAFLFGRFWVFCLRFEPVYAEVFKCTDEDGVEAPSFWAYPVWFAFFNAVGHAFGV